MSLLQRLSTVVPLRPRATTISDYNQAFFAGDPLPDLWLSALSGAGVEVSPDLAMTLSAYRCGVATIAYDIATLLLRGFKVRADGGADLVRSTTRDDPSIGGLAYRLQWQPNAVQTAVEFFASTVAQLKMRNVAYAEIVPGRGGFADQLLPRHPDRTRPERLPNGRLRFKLTEANGQPPRYVSQDEMFVVRDISTDGGLSVLSSVAYGANMFGTALAAERAAGRFFKTGMTAALLATYTGEMEDEDEDALHRAISRYAAGVENSFGMMLVPDDVKISNLAVSPEKAQMMLAREWTVFEVARDLRISPRKLMVRGQTSSYASAYQDAIDHVVNCLRPVTVLIQQSLQRDVVLEQDVYRFVFHLGELLKGDPAQMGVFIEQLIKSRAMTPSEVRMTYLDMNPNDRLDQLSESDNKPGASSPATPATEPAAIHTRLQMRAVLTVHDQAVRCLRRERAAVEKLAKKHANDVDGWRASLREFYGEHAGFVAETLRLHPTVARGYAAQHGAELEAQGITVFDGEAWERFEADELTALALGEGSTIDAWFDRRQAMTRPIHHHD